VASGFCSGGDRTGTGCGLAAARPADDDDVVVLPDDVGVLLAIAAHVIGLAGFAVNNTVYMCINATKTTKSQNNKNTHIHLYDVSRSYHTHHSVAGA